MYDDPPGLLELYNRTINCDGKNFMIKTNGGSP
jgi:hypothetical protein